jgi:subtilisin family serine protease
MDPLLQELIVAGDADDVVRVVARFDADRPIPEGVKVVSRFGDVATVEVVRGELQQVWESPAIESLKGPQVFDQHPATIATETEAAAPQPAASAPAQPPARHYQGEDEHRPEHLPETGHGVVIGCADWGLDFAHPDFRGPDGQTRLLALWDQRGGEHLPGSGRHGYGVVHDRDAINRALAAADPYATLAYHPADADLGHGCHGTHCLSIAGGTGSAETPPGVAPGADLVFVHLDSSAAGGGNRPLGDSVTLLDALDFCRATAAAAPLVLSLSLGSHGGAHDGTSLVERAIDNFVTASAGRAICQSAGNYYERRVHTSGRLRPGDTQRIGWLTERSEAIPHQIEVWYSAADVITASLRAPDGRVEVTVAPGESREIQIRGVTVGRIHHRTREPNNGRSHIAAFLYVQAPGGRWELSLVADDVADGRYYCWVEREAGCPTCQSHLDETEIVKQSTTGSVCNGLRTIAVGAYDARASDRPLAPFSSAGPTLDGRQKPDLAAPGVAVLAARSTPRGEQPGARSTRMSGTSMAAPHVAGTVALMFEAARRLLPIAETRRLLSETADPASFSDERRLRVGDGYLDIEHAVTSTRPQPGGNREPRSRTSAAARAAGTDASLEVAETIDEHKEASELTFAPDTLEQFAREANELIAAADAEEWQGEHWPGLVTPDESEPVVETGPIGAGRLVIDEVPLLATHRGTHPDLILHWNAMPENTTTVDIVVHFHGYSGRGAAMRLDVDKEPRSGLDFSNPDNASDPRPGRRRPTLCLLPRGNYFGGHSGAGYDHPALATATGVRELIALALERFALSAGIQVTPGRLILTGHSGGGAGVLRALPHNDPHEVHIFDGLYGPAGALERWVETRIRAEVGGGGPGALRVLYIPNAGTEAHSLEVGRTIRTLLDGPHAPDLAARYRVEATTVAHNNIPRRFGWMLLADPAVQLSGGPTTTRPTPDDAGTTATPDEPRLREQWDAHPRIHGWVEGGLSGYIQLGPMYAQHGIADAAAYLDQNIIESTFFGRRFPTHRLTAQALAAAEHTLRGAGVTPEIHSIWSVVSRPIRGRSNLLSQHALGLAVDINPATNPLLRARDNHDVIQVIAAVTGTDLGTTQPAGVLRQASAAFRAGYNDDWLAARQRDLIAAQQGGDSEQARRLQALLAAAQRHDIELRRLARTGFFDLDQRLIDALTGAGMTWGGSWASSKDFMHFELHVAAGGLSAPSLLSGASSTPPEPVAPPTTPTPSPAGGATQPPAGGWPMAPLPGTGITLTPAQERHIRQQLAHVVRFYRRYAELTIADQQATGVPATFTLAQGGVESGWGRHTPGNMLFGVKANENRVPLADRQLLWTSETVTDPNHYDRYEHEPAQPVIDQSTGQQATDRHGRLLYTIRVKLWFRRFDSESASIANHSHLLLSNRRYGPAFQHTADPVAFARAVARAGYATGQEHDSAYERALVSAIELVDHVAAYVRSHPDAGARQEILEAAATGANGHDATTTVHELVTGILG